jgi:hypothetical protein
VNRKQFKQWLKRMYATGPAELACDQLQAMLPALVDFEITGGDPRLRFSAALAHVAQCPDCAEEYSGLRHIVRLEAQGRLPQIDESLNEFEESPALEQREPA